MRPPLVSIIVPTYNRPDLLRRALKSIDEQVYTDCEAIVVNDGGSDVSNVVAEFHRARLINHDKNCGLPAARNTGLADAGGKWIGYLDDDDWFYPEHIRTCVDALGAHDARWVYTNTDAYWSNGCTRPYMDADYSAAGILRHNITPVLCVLHERSLLDVAGWFDESLPNHEDWDLWIRFSWISPPYHVHKTTCCIDRSRPSMISNVDAMVTGRDYIRLRYAGAVTA